MGAGAGERTTLHSLAPAASFMAERCRRAPAFLIHAGSTVVVLYSAIPLKSVSA